MGTSLVVQWLRIRLAVPGTRVRSLAGELRSHMLGVGRGEQSPCPTATEPLQRN